MTCYDLDDLIEQRANKPISEIFSVEGEAGFRNRESEALDDILSGGPSVVALGGGALLDAANRDKVEQTGKVICLRADTETILLRLGKDDNTRPLLDGDKQSRLLELLTSRAEHYSSFSTQLSTENIAPEQLAWRVQILLGMFHVTGMKTGYDVRFSRGGLCGLGQELEKRGLLGPVAVISDDNVGPLYVQNIIDTLSSTGYAVEKFIIPAGENYKTVSTVTQVWESLVRMGLDRGSTIIALGGGVVGDLAGFAAATYLRGIRWVCVPTSILAMVDASLGGKTGADLEFGKNLIGAFHPPSLVFVDPITLETLPQAEKRSGMAEVVKHGIIGEPVLYELCNRGWDVVNENLDEILLRAMAVKIQIIRDDPFERGKRATLNLGHTLGHGIEKASDYSIRHGEAVAIGIVAAARYAETTGIADAGISKNISDTMSRLGLPTEIPAGLPLEDLVQAMGLDKKRAKGSVKLVLPVRIGEVRYGISLDDLMEFVNPGATIY